MRWLASFLASEGKLHFAYRADAGPAGEPRYRQHYVRVDCRQ